MVNILNMDQALRNSMFWFLKRPLPLTFDDLHMQCDPQECLLEEARFKFSLPSYRFWNQPKLLHVVPAWVHLQRILWYLRILSGDGPSQAVAPSGLSTPTLKHYPRNIFGLLLWLLISIGTYSVNFQTSCLWVEGFRRDVAHKAFCRPGLVLVILS